MNTSCKECGKATTGKVCLACAKKLSEGRKCTSCGSPFAEKDLSWVMRVPDTNYCEECAGGTLQDCEASIRHGLHRMHEQARTFFVLLFDTHADLTYEEWLTIDNALMPLRSYLEWTEDTVREREQEEREGRDPDDYCEPPSPQKYQKYKASKEAKMRVAGQFMRRLLATSAYFSGDWEECCGDIDPDNFCLALLRMTYGNYRL